MKNKIFPNLFYVTIYCIIYLQQYFVFILTHTLTHLFFVVLFKICIQNAVVITIPIPQLQLRHLVALNRTHLCRMVYHHLLSKAINYHRTMKRSIHHHPTQHCFQIRRKPPMNLRLDQTLQKLALKPQPKVSLPQQTHQQMLPSQLNPYQPAEQLCLSHFISLL